MGDHIEAGSSTLTEEILNEQATGDESTENNMELALQESLEVTATGTKRKFQSDESITHEEYIDISNLTEQEQQRLIDSRILQVLELSDFEDDDDLYYEALSADDNNDIYMPKATVPIPNGMTQLPKLKFLTVKELLEIILNPDLKPLRKIPIGKKENVYCILNNINEPFTPSNNSLIRDDYGLWETASNTSQHHVVYESGDFKLVVRYHGQYAFRTKKPGEYNILDPQPDDSNIMSITRIYQRLDGEPSRQRKVSRFTAIPKMFDTAMGHCAFYDIFEYLK